LNLKTDNIFTRPNLEDSYGRYMRKLRISLLDACNFRCLYCMPENRVFIAQKDYLRADEIFEISKNLVNHGIDQIRLTGGEPTLRSDFIEVVKLLDTLKLKSFGVTSNALKLDSHLEALADTSCQHLNISLDSLDRENFQSITRVDGLKQVLKCIDHALNFNFKVKVNVVLMRGKNHHEVDDFVKFSAQTGVEVRFLELMKIGVVRDQFEDLFISADEVIDHLKIKYQFKNEMRPKDSTSFNFRLSNGAQIGFIASESKPFCTGCSRLRLGPRGELRPCLMMDESISLRGLASEDYPHVLRRIINKKPLTRIEDLPQAMYQVGG